MQRKWPMNIFDLYGWIEHWKRNLTIYEMIGQQDRSLDQLKHLNETERSGKSGFYCHKITLAMFESRVDIWLGTILNSRRRGRSTYRITTFKDFRWTRKSMIFWLILGLYLKSSIPHCVTDTAQYWMTLPGPHILLSKPPACGQGLSPWWRWALPPRPPSPSSPRQR